MVSRCGRVGRVPGESIRRSIERGLRERRGVSLAEWCEAWARATGQDSAAVCRAARRLLRRLERGEAPVSEVDTWLVWSLEASLPGAIPAGLVPAFDTSPYARQVA